MRYGVFRVGRGRVLTAFIAVLAGILIIHGANRSVSVSSGQRSIPIYSVEMSEKKVSMGFNCAWDNEDIPLLIEILAEHGIKASFFVSGSWCKKYPESVKALYDAGHEIGSHSNTHADLAKLGRDAIIEEIVLCNEKIKAVIGVSPKLFRMPSGSYNNLVIETIKSQDMIAIQWDCERLNMKTINFNNGIIVNKIGVVFMHRVLCLRTYSS